MGVCDFLVYIWEITRKVQDYKTSFWSDGPVVKSICCPPSMGTAAYNSSSRVRMPLTCAGILTPVHTPTHIHITENRESL